MTIRYLVGDALKVLRTLPARSVQCCVTSPPYYGLRSYLPNDHPDKLLEVGLEQSPRDYIANLVAIFREVRRVLRDDGTLWINIGDSYASGGGAGKQGKRGQRFDRRHTQEALLDRRYWTDSGIKPKDLIGIPWMLAFALRDDGWWLRNDCIWAKRNCMPESIKDRCTRAHEYIFHFTKSEKSFFDNVAIEEQGDIPAGTRAAKGATARSDIKNVNGRPPEYWEYTGRRNKRTVWRMATQPFPEAHFAVYPQALPETCILAATSERGCCSTCGAPWTRIVERKSMVIQRSERTHEFGHTRSSGTMLEPATSKTIGWQPICTCSTQRPIPCTVLDPFAGAATSLLVADRLGRDAIGIDLNADYAPMAQRRFAKAGLHLQVPQRSTLLEDALTLMS